MRKFATIILTILVIATVLWAGGDPWKTKPYQQWDSKDIQTIMQDSPWAKVSMIPGTMRPGDIGGNLNGSSNAAPGTAALAAEHDSSAADPSLTKGWIVVWWSAKTIRKATARSGLLKGLETESQAEASIERQPDDFEILVHGPEMAAFAQRGEQSFMDKSSLTFRNTKQKISPTKIEFQHDSSGSMSGVVFHFPKIDPGGKEIDFFCRIATYDLRVTFDPKKMTIDGGEDL